MNTVSIIVPIYNAQKYIKYCLDSILKQTYREFEVILVDDGSQDASGRICDYYAKKDHRITVYHRENAGVSASRNFGLANATGKYILFVDADDTIEPDMLEGCIRLAENNGADLVICSFRYYMTNNNNKMVENRLENEVCVTDKELFDQWFQVLVDKEILNPPWNKFIRKDLLDTNQIRFHEEFSICEDMMFSVEILNISKKIVLTDCMYYNYYLKTKGTLVFKFHENYFEALTKFYEIAYKYCIKFKKNVSQLTLINTLYVNLTIMFLKQICIKSNWDKSARNFKMNEISKNEDFLRALNSIHLNRRKTLICNYLKKGKFNFINIIYVIKNMKAMIRNEG